MSSYFDCWEKARGYAANTVCSDVYGTEIPGN